MSTRILLVDSDDFQLGEVKESLTRQGYLVVGEAGDGGTALHLARQLRPDLVMMDIHLQDESGANVAKTITQEKIAPVVILTALTDLPYIENANTAGIINYIVKPLRESEVVPTVEVSLARYKALKALEEQVASLTDQLETRKLVERAKGLLMLRYSLPEQEAFSKIRKASMETHKPMRAVAEAILLASDL
jgi:response regulator NasT